MDVEHLQKFDSQIKAHYIYNIYQIMMCLFT